MRAVSITIAQRGFRGRKTKWRVAISETSAWDPSTDARSCAGRAAIASGKARVSYVRGTREEAEKEGVRPF